MINKNIKYKLLMLYKDVLYVNDNLCFCKKDEYWYKYNIDARKLEELKIYDLVFYNKEKCVIAVIYNGTNVYNLEGKIIYRAGLNTEIDKIVCNLVVIRIKKLLGVTRMDGEIILGTFYDSIQIYKDPKVIIAKEKEDVRIFNHNGKIMIERLYDKVVVGRQNRLIAYIGDCTYMLEIKENGIVEKIVVSTI